MPQVSFLYLIRILQEIFPGGKEETGMSGFTALDGGILLFIQEHLRYAWMDGFWQGVTSLGNGGWFWILTAVIFLCYKKTRKAGFYALLSMLFGFVVTNLWLKNMVARPRPFDAIPQLILLIPRPTDFSFPSGHTTVSFASALIYRKLLPKRYGTLFMILAAMIAWSRLYLGAHYPSDVIGGFFVAVAGSSVCLWGMGRMERKNGRIYK